VEDPDFGVSCRRIDGHYEVGQGRNRQEAAAIVEEAAELMRARLDRSIGIVAVNQAQRDLIETLMDERTASDPDIQAYRQEWSGKLVDSTTGADGSKPGLPATKVDSVSGVTMNPGQNVAAVIAAQANDGRKGYRP
jgi:hypothetical protein